MHDDETPAATAFSMVLTLLLACGLGLAVAACVVIPFHAVAGEGLSALQLEKWNPLTNYVRYAILLILPVSALLLACSRRERLRAKVTQCVKAAAGRLARPGPERHLVVASLLLVWAIDVNWDLPLNRMTDNLHEGEYVGYLPTVRASENPLADVLVVHGPGINVAPMQLADRLVGPDRRLAATRTIRTIAGLFSTAACLWIVHELAALAGGAAAREKLFLLGTLFFCAWHRIGYRFRYFSAHPNLRALVFLFQLALLLRLLRCLEERPERAPVAASALLGLLVPVGLLNNYAQGLLILPLLPWVLVLAACRSIRGAVWAGCVLGASAGAATAACWLWLGRVQSEAVVLQIAYWLRHATAIVAMPLTVWQMTRSAEFLGMWLTHILALVWLFSRVRRDRDPRAWSGFERGLLVLIGANVVVARIAMMRSDGDHFMIASQPAALLLVGLVLLALLRLCSWEQLSSDRLCWPSEPGRILALGLAVGLVLPDLAPMRLVSNVKRTWVEARLRDSEIVPPDYQEAARILKPEVNRSATFFTLTSEGIWYYLFDKPSASRYHQIFYARSPEAEAEIINDLALKRPEIVLVTNDFWTNKPFDGNLRMEDVLPRLYAFVRANYRFFKKVGSHEFWKRAT